jgi:hypothetical protein
MTVNIPALCVDAMKSYFGDDERRINHAMSVLGFAREIRGIEGGDEVVVECAAALHDIGIHEAERKHGSSAGNFQEIEGPPIAKGILAELAANAENVLTEERIEHIAAIIANHHSARDIDTLEFRIIWDSDWLVNIPDEYDLNDKDKINNIVETVFKTDTGRKIASDIFY